MASSGTYNFNPSAGQCVILAYDRCQIRLPSLRQEHFNTAFMEQNLTMVKFSNLQPNLWTVDLQTVTLTPGVATITLPASTVLVLDGYITTNPGSQYGQNNRYITQLSRTEYASLSNPLTQGPPTQIWFDRLLVPTITFWPVPDSNGPYTFSYYRAVQIQDVAVAGGQTLNMPYLWMDAYVSELSWRFAMSYAPQIEDKRKMQAQEAWTVAASQNIEVVNLSLAPPVGRYYPR
jgi:hypothetical protein